VRRRRDAIQNITGTTPNTANGYRIASSRKATADAAHAVDIAIVLSEIPGDSSGSSEGMSSSRAVMTEK
jgi:hypothetical protein